MKLLTSLLALACASVLSACGGGGGDSTPSTPAAAQQFPGGVWEGTSGSGTTQRSFFGYIDPGLSGTGGDFYFARPYSPANGFDSLYGALSVTGQALAGTGVSYFSGQDEKFVNNIVLRGTVTSNAQGQASRIAGNYTDATGTTAATGAIVPFQVDYSRLNNYPATLAGLQGTYRSVGTFGAVWRLDINAQGKVVGTYSGCTVDGAASVRSATSAAFGMVFTLTGEQATCVRSGTTQTGVAVLQYDTDGKRTGIWVLTRNATGPTTVLALNGIVDPGTVPPASASQQDPQGSWIGKLTGTNGTQDFAGSVLPDGSYFFYKRVGSGFDTLYGGLAVATGSSTLSSNDGVYYAAQSGLYSGGVTLTGDVKTAAELNGRFFDPTARNTLSSFALTPDANYPYILPLGISLANLTGTYKSTAAAFGGNGITLTVDGALGTIVGETTSGCKVAGRISRYGSDVTRNTFAVDRFGFSGTDCPLVGTPLQSGIAQFSPVAPFGGLRILAAGAGNNGVRATTVFLGERQTGF